MSTSAEPAKPAEPTSFGATRLRLSQGLADATRRGRQRIDARYARSLAFTAIAAAMEFGCIVIELRTPYSPTRTWFPHTVAVLGAIRTVPPPRPPASVNRAPPAQPAPAEAAKPGKTAPPAKAGPTDADATPSSSQP